VEQYIDDAKLDNYNISSGDELEDKDCTEKLITAFAFKRYLFDYCRKKAGVDVKRLKSLKIINSSCGLLCSTEIAEHRIEINETGKVKHSLYNRESKKAVNIYNYSADKYWTRDFLNFLELITTEWEEDYSVNVCDGYEWVCTLKYVDGTTKNIKGTVESPPSSEDIEKRIRNLVDYEVEPWLF